MIGAIKYLIICLTVLIVGVGVAVGISNVGCMVHKIERPETPACCQRVYDIMYLSQKLVQPPDVSKFIDCCRIQDKIEFCKKQESKDECLALMKTF